MCVKNRNILAAFLFRASNGVTYSIWGSPLLPLFLQVFTGDSTTSARYVGIAEGIQGATQCVFALISGVLADKLSRHVVLKAAGFSQILAAAMTLFAVYFSSLFPAVSPQPNASDTLSYFSTLGHGVVVDDAIHEIALSYVGLGQLGPANGTDQCTNTSTAFNSTTAAPVAPFDPHGNLQWYLLCASCGMWGVYSGLYGPSMEALFADSIETGQRAKFYTIRNVVQTVARATGPLLALVAFYLLNDKWTLPTLTWVLTGGLVLTIVPSLVLICLFHDKYTIGLKNEAITVTRKTIEERQSTAGRSAKATTTTEAAATRVMDDDNNKVDTGKKVSGASGDPEPQDGLASVSEEGEEEEEEEEPDDNSAGSEDSGAPIGRSISKRSGSGSGTPEPRELVDPLAAGDDGEADNEGKEAKEVKDGDGDDDDEEKETCCCKCCAGVRAIPWIILASNTVTGFATGMTVKFFPLFFKNEVCLTPAAVNIIYAVTPFIQALATYGSRYVAKSFGRVMTVQIQRLLGTTCLFIMAWRTELWSQPWIIVPLYVLRTVLTSCGWPLMNSVLNDYTMKKHRAKFNSMQSIAGFGWSFSALAGGFIISSFTVRTYHHPDDMGAGFSLVFYITCAFQVVTLGLRFIIVPLMPRKEITTDETLGRSSTESPDLTDDETLGVAEGVIVQTPTARMGGNREERRHHPRALDEAEENNLAEPLLGESGGEQGVQSSVVTDPNDPRFGYGGGRPGAKPRRHHRGNNGRQLSGGAPSDQRSYSGSEDSASASIIYTYREDSGGADV